MKKNSLDKIIIHHSASKSTVTSKQISEWHKSKGFYYNKAFDNYIGYHFLIFPNGKIEQTKLLKDEGCHTIGQNTSSIGICMIGNFETKHPSLKQTSSLMSLIDYLYKVIGKQVQVFGHCKFSNTLCPGKNLKWIVETLNSKEIKNTIYR